MPQETKSHIDHENSTAFTRGMRIQADDPILLRHAIAMAVNYRGDVTITRASTGEVIEGFVFDHRASEDPVRDIVRMIPKDGSAKLNLPCSDIASLEFTGRDTAQGKSFETWMKKYVRQKLAGEAAGIEPESLEED